MLLLLNHFINRDLGIVSDDDLNSSTYYALVDQIDELAENEFEFTFDGIQSDWFDERIASNSRLRQYYQEFTSYQFRIVVPPYLYKLIIPELGRYRKNQSVWVEITVNEKVGYPIQLLANNSETSEILDRFVSKLNFLSNSDPKTKQLKRFFSWDDFDIANKEQIKHQVIESLRNNGPIHLNIYNVGQGSLSAICNRHEYPLIYYDLGGGFAWHRNTYPNPLHLFLDNVNTIILSHWDWDHIETARRARHGNWGDYNGKTWIVPKQPLSPGYASFLSHIAATGNLLIWPDNLHRVIVKDIEIIKCHGPHKNHSGLAIIVTTRQNAINKTLHPGDAAYKFIYIRKRTLLTGLVATHHGANFETNNTPVPFTKNGCIAYSYGIPGYGHPKADAVYNYENNGWGTVQQNRLDTAINDHISLQRHVPNMIRYNCQINNCMICNLTCF